MENTIEVATVKQICDFESKKNIRIKDVQTGLWQREE